LSSAFDSVSASRDTDSLAVVKLLSVRDADAFVAGVLEGRHYKITYDIVNTSGDAPNIANSALVPITTQSR
jgi:hypothetical protein